MSADRTASGRPSPLLLGLLGVVLAIAAWRYLPSFGGGAGFTGTTSADLRSTTIDVVELAAYTLDQPPPASRPERDPWSFGTPPPPPAPETAAPEPVAPPTPEPEPEEPDVPAAPQPKPPTPAPVRPRPAPVDVFYIGSFGRSDRPIAVFIDTEKSIFNAIEGGLVKDRFEVQNIGYESVDLLFVGFPDEPAVRLAIGGRPSG